MASTAALHFDIDTSSASPWYSGTEIFIRKFRHLNITEL